MTRSGPPEPPAGPWQPLGSPTPKPAPTPASEWDPVPDTPGIERNRLTGRLRTNLPLPK
jgi:hypothetical protein